MGNSWLIYVVNRLYVRQVQVYLACANVKPDKSNNGNQTVNFAEKMQIRVTDMSVIGDVSDCIGHCVHALRILVRNFDGKFLFDGEDNLDVHK